MDEMKKRFVTEDEVEERRQKRQEEWEKVRKPDQPLEAPEEEVDNRSLFEKLQEQKVKKQDEYDESHKLRNMVKGLENDEVEFLDFVSRRQEEIDEERKLEEKILLSEYKNAVINKVVSVTEKPKLSEKKPMQSTSGMKSQKKLLAGVVKRKSSTDIKETNAKKSNTECSSSSTETSVKESKTENTSLSTQVRYLASGDSSSESLSSLSTRNGFALEDIVSPPQTAQVIGILPGFGYYSNSSDSDSENSSISEDNPTTIMSLVQKIKGTAE